MGEQTACAKLSVLLNKATPYLLMVGLQFGAAGMYITSMVTLNSGMSRFVLIVYRNAVAALVLAPFALVFERKIRPKMTISIFLKIMVLGFLEPILDQNLSYLGMDYTSASYTSAIMNAVPAVTFIIAVILRLERVKINEVRSQAKVIGTLVTFAGALLMTLYKGPIIDLLWTHRTIHHESSTDLSGKHWLTGTLLILVGCCAWSCFFVLQGVVSSGITYYVQGLVMKTRGPVFVTAFNPLCMIIVSILGSAILAEKLHLGSIIGGMIIAIGLYSVVWGKSKDQISQVSSTEEKSGAQELPITAADGTKSFTAGDEHAGKFDVPTRMPILHK